MELLVNAYQSTLSASYTAGAGSISLTSATGLPTLASPDTMHFSIYDQSTGALKLIIKATARTTTTLTIVAETTDVNCASGDIIKGSELTVGSILQLIADTDMAGTISGRPSAARTGAIYRASDSLFDFARYNGSSWDQYCGGLICTPPTTAALSTAKATPNGTEVSFADANDGVILSATATTGDNIVMRLQAYPSTPFKQRMRFRFNSACASFDNAGLAIYNSSNKKAITYGAVDRRSTSDDFVAYSWNTVDTAAASFYIATTGMVMRTTRGAVADIVLEDDGTNRKLWFLIDGIWANRVLFKTTLNNDVVAPDKIGIFTMIYPGPASPSGVLSVLDWSLI